jgi:adenylate cyclase
VSRAVAAAGGSPNQVLEDGLLALFGLAGFPEEACRAAVVAAAMIAANVEKLNGALSYGLLEPIRFGIGVHAGLAIAGDIGYERHAQFTAIGDPVNVASRLQGLTKSLGCEVLMSEEVYVWAGFWRRTRSRSAAETPSSRLEPPQERPTSRSSQRLKRQRRYDRGPVTSALLGVESSPSSRIRPRCKPFLDRAR